MNEETLTKRSQLSRYLKKKKKQQKMSVTFKKETRESTQLGVADQHLENDSQWDVLQHKETYPLGTTYIIDLQV